MTGGELPAARHLEEDFAQNIDGYVATPGGRVWLHIAAERLTFQVCGRGCVPSDKAAHPCKKFLPKIEYTILQLKQIDAHRSIKKNQDWSLFCRIRCRHKFDAVELNPDFSRKIDGGIGYAQGDKAVFTTAATPACYSSAQVAAAAARVQAQNAGQADGLDGKIFHKHI